MTRSLSCISITWGLPAGSSSGVVVVGTHSPSGLSEVLRCTSFDVVAAESAVISTFTLAMFILPSSLHGWMFPRGEPALLEDGANDAGKAVSMNHVRRADTLKPKHPCADQRRRGDGDGEPRGARRALGCDHLERLLISTTAAPAGGGGVGAGIAVRWMGGAAISRIDAIARTIRASTKCSTSSGFRKTGSGALASSRSSSAAKKAGR